MVSIVKPQSLATAHEIGLFSCVGDAPQERYFQTVVYVERKAPFF